MKYGARRTYSELCGRTFASKAEARRGEELALLEKAGEITELEYQPRFVLCEKPRVTITLDFAYRLPDRTDLPAKAHPSQKIQWTYEDVKGVLTRDFRTKLAWLKEKHSIDVELIRV